MPTVYETRITLEAALDLCDTIDNRVVEFPRYGTDELPESAGRFVEEVRPKVQSMQEYFLQKGYLTIPQKSLLLGILGGLEKWSGETQ